MYMIGRLGKAFFSLIFLICIYVMVQSATTSKEQKSRIAVDAYIYGYPLVTMEMTRRVMTNTESTTQTKAPMGQFIHMRSYLDASFRDVTAPNADTLYSIAWLDLSKE